MNTKRTHVVLSDQLVKEIDTLVGTRRRSSFLTQAAEEKLMRMRQLKALESAAEAWKDKDHPELKKGAAKWVRKLRQESRFQKVSARSWLLSSSTPASSSTPSTKRKTGGSFCVTS